jgi:hypothetical protein
MMKRILVLVFVCGIGSFAALAQAPAPPTNVRLVTGAAVLSSSELVPLGVFASPNSGTTSASFTLPVTGRYESDGKFHYLQVRGDGSIGEFAEPTLSPMSTPYASIPAATWDTWTGGGGQGVWGTPNWNDDCTNLGNTANGRPSCNAAIFGVKWFPDQQAICETWSPLYGSLYPHAATFGCYTLSESTHTLANRLGCWGMSNVANVIAAGGMLEIPDAWANANLSGRKYVIGFGEPGALGGLTNSHGPDLHAFAWPAQNDCPSTATGGTYPYTLTGTVMEEHLAGSAVGPNCYMDANTANKIGCTPTQAPTRPYAMAQKWTGYSSSTYVFNWNPWSGPSPLPATQHGWMSAYATQWALDWYDDTAFGGTRYGVVMPYVTPSGWLNQTVLASPAPTYVYDQSKFFYPLITFAVSSLDTHDGATVNPGDIIWVQGCRPGTDLGCTTENMDYLDYAVVRSVSGNVITAYVTNLDNCSSCSHVPPVGGLVLEGGLYVHGMPNLIRQVERLKVCDPNVYRAVIADPSQADLVQCDDEIDAHALAPFFGCPTCPETIYDSKGQMDMKGVPVTYGTPVSVLADPEHRKIRVAYSTGKNGYVVIAVWGVVPK